MEYVKDVRFIHPYDGSDCYVDIPLNMSLNTVLTHLINKRVFNSDGSNDYDDWSNTTSYTVGLIQADGSYVSLDKNRTLEENGIENGSTIKVTKDTQFELHNGLRNLRYYHSLGVTEGQALQDMPFGIGEMSIRSSKGNSWSFNHKLLSSHILAIGSIGTGKTNLLYHLVKEVINSLTDKDIVIFFDSKGDFLKRFYRVNDYVIGNSQQYAGYNPAKWNIYKEIRNGGSLSREDTIREIATSLFRKRMNESREPTFASGARDIFAAIIESQFRENASNLNNSSLRKKIRDLDVNFLKSMIERHADMRWINMYIHDARSATTQSYLSPLGSVVNDVFSAHFAEAGDFSIREALRQKGGKSIFLEYDIVNSNLLDSVYTVLLDLASKDALGSETDDSKVYFVLDEFPLIPKLGYIDNLLNFGRSRGVRVIAGIQNISQVMNTYEGTLGTSVLSGFSTYLAFRLFDEASRKFVSERHGQNRKRMRIPISDILQNPSPGYERGLTIEDWDIVSLRNGECIVSLPDKNPYRFYPALYPEPQHRITISKPSPQIEIRRQM